MLRSAFALANASTFPPGLSRSQRSHSELGKQIPSGYDLSLNGNYQARWEPGVAQITNGVFTSLFTFPSTSSKKIKEQPTKPPHSLTQTGSSSLDSKTSSSEGKTLDARRTRRVLKLLYHERKHAAAMLGVVSVEFEGWPDLKSMLSDGLAPSS